MYHDRVVQELKVNRGDKYTCRPDGDLICLLLFFFKNNESRLKMLTLSKCSLKQQLR
jgi:hypothetical protein